MTDPTIKAETAMESYIFRYQNDPTFHHLVHRLVQSRNPEEVLGFLAAGRVLGDLYLDDDARELLERHELVLGLTEEGEFGLWHPGEEGPLGRGDTLRTAVMAANLAAHVRRIQRAPEPGEGGWEGDAPYIETDDVRPLPDTKVPPPQAP